MTTLAAIDRVVHHSVILDLMGMESYRAHEATVQHRVPHLASPAAARPLPPAAPPEAAVRAGKVPA